MSSGGHWLPKFMPISFFQAFVSQVFSGKRIYRNAGIHPISFHRRASRFEGFKQKAAYFCFCFVRIEKAVARMLLPNSEASLEGGGGYALQSWRSGREPLSGRGHNREKNRKMWLGHPRKIGPFNRGKIAENLPIHGWRLIFCYFSPIFLGWPNPAFLRFSSVLPSAGKGLSARPLGLRDRSQNENRKTTRIFLASRLDRYAGVASYAHSTSFFHKTHSKRKKRKLRGQLMPGWRQDSPCCYNLELQKLQHLRIECRLPHQRGRGMSTNFFAITLRVFV